MGKFFPAALNVAAKLCDLCKSEAALLFCRPDSAFMCIACDAKAHNTAPAAEHERVWMCEVCEQAPAAVTCKADAAALCAACDRDIHSANPLAGRHDRVPVVPFHHTAEAAVMKSTAAAASGGDSSTHLFADKLETVENGYIPDPWISMSPINNMATKQYPADNTELKSMELLFQDSDGFLNFDHNYQISSQPFADGVVPDQPTIKPPAHVPAHDFSSGNRFIIDFAGSNINSHTTSLSHSVSSSSMDVGVVPDGSETSYPFGRSINPGGSQAVGMDREARVLRYKEKRKNRKFEKTIRYASRKAYAETRPRIKGRFAKRTDPEPDINRIFGTGPAGYVVPSF